MKPKKTECRREHGVALITTVIVVAVLAVVAVAMMQTTTVDRLSSRSVANSYRARLAADAGAVLAKGMVADLFARYPDSVTGWQNIGGGDVFGTNNEATVLYIRAQAADPSRGASPSAAPTNIIFQAQPLISRRPAGGIMDAIETNPVAISSVTSLLPYTAGTTTDALDLNATNGTRTEPFIGSRSAYKPGAPVTAAQWIYMTKDGGPFSSSNPYVARFAFWIEDESFKVNVNIASEGPRGSGSLGTKASEVRLNGAFTNSSITTINSMDLATVVNTRSNLPGGVFPSAATLAVAGNVDSSGSGEMRFLTTDYSAGLDLSRGGFRRFPLVPANLTSGDINGLKRFIAAITNTNACPDFGQRFYKSAATADSASYAGLLNQNHVTVGRQSVSTASVPFAADLYLLRLAANLKDALDSDNAPTFITGTNVSDAQFLLPDTIESHKKPASAWAISPAGGGTVGRPLIYTDGAGSRGTNLAAIGKENIPRLQEYAIHGRVLSMNPVGVNDPKNDNSGATFKVAIDHYLEFWNMGSEDIDLRGFYFRLYDMPVANLKGDTLSGSCPALTDPARSVTLLVVEDSSLPPSSYTIPAGGCKVITTANPMDFTQINTNMFESMVDGGGQPVPSKVYNVFANAIAVDSSTLQPVPLVAGEGPWRVFNGTTFAYVSGDSKATNAAGTIFNEPYAIKTTYRTTTLTDYGTTLVVGHTNYGFMDSLVGLPIAWSGSSGAFTLDARHPDRLSVAAPVPASPNRGQNLYFLRSSSLMGNLSTFQPATTTAGFGDPLAAVGDPSTLNEALNTIVYSSTEDRAGQARLLSITTESAGGVRCADPAPMDGTGRILERPGRTPPQPNPGTANSEYVDPSRWPDCGAASSGIYYIPSGLNGGLRTIGDLGFLADPARLQGTTSSADNARGGGRTLRIGQSELFNRTNNRSGLWDGSQTNASRNRVAWRLADIFTTNRNTTNISIAGLVNPNGALRDGGAAMRAAVFGMTMMGAPEGSPSPVAGRALNLSNLITTNNTNSPSLICRLTNTNRWIPGALNPLWERGEISELGGSYAFPSLVANLNAQSVYDRSREEIMRRTIDMVTMRGSIFSAYVVGQALQVSQNATNVLATARLRQTFEILPVLPSATDSGDTFDPTNPVARFSPLTNFTTRVLRNFYD